MDKQKAIALFGGKLAQIAEAMDISESAVSQWPKNLPLRISDRVLGAAYRLGKLPCKCPKRLQRRTPQV